MWFLIFFKGFAPLGDQRADVLVDNQLILMNTSLSEGGGGVGGLNTLTQCCGICQMSVMFYNGWCVASFPTTVPYCSKQNRCSFHLAMPVRIQRVC